MDKKGFTLIEIMISIALLAIILVALTHAAVVIIGNNARFEHRKTALTLAQETINSLSSLSYNSNLLSDVTTGTTFLSSPTPDPDSDGNVYILDKDHNGSYSSTDINDAGDATEGIDHPSGSSNYASIQPIEQISPVTYYKVWGIENLTDMKRITVVVYWFEGGSTDFQHVHYVFLTTYKRRP